MRFSVTIPAFKAKFLKDCIESILAQTYDDLELLIVDDASPEDIFGIVNQFRDPRIRYYRNKENCGAINVVDNWNKCLEYAKGDYIICMGDDDMLMPNCLEDYCKLIKKYPGLGVYHAFTQIINEKGEFVNITASRPEFESVYSLIWHRLDNRKQQFIGDFLFDTQLLKKNGGFFKLPLAWASDDLSAVIAAKFTGIANTQEIGFCYRVNTQTISNTGNIVIKMGSIEKERLWFISFLSEEPNTDMDRKYWLSIKQILPHCFEKIKGSIIAQDLKENNILRLLFWVRNRDKYKLTYKVLFYSLYLKMKG